MTYPISLLDWESKFFGFPIGEFDLPADYDPGRLEETLRNGKERFRLVCLTLGKIGPDLIATSDIPCVCYDKKLMLKKDVPRNVPSLDPHVKAYTSTFCSKWLERLAVQSGALSRFKRDPELATQYERLFLTWINYSVAGNLADSIWTWRENDRDVGLVTIRCAKREHPETGELQREGRIGMLSVDEPYRERGIDRQLFGACDFWCSSLSIPVASIATQFDNDRMIALCEEMGFRKDREESVYHYWSPGWVYDAHRGWIRLGYAKTG